MEKPRSLITIFPVGLNNPGPHFKLFGFNGHSVSVSVSLSERETKGR